MYKFNILAVLLLGAFIIISCDIDGDDAEPELYSTPVEGRLTVDEELDDTGNYGNIHVRILNYFEPETDTLYHAVTDRDGYFSGEARFAERDEYMLEITRGGNEIAETELILAEGDTIRIEAELPEFDTETVISSREFEAMQEYRRLMNQFTRVSAYINAGLVSDEEALDNLHTWNDLFWGVSENHPGTLAANRAIVQAVGILQGWDNDKMFEQLASDPEMEPLVEAGLFHGVPERIEEGGLDAGLSFMDTLWERSRHEGNRQLIGIHRVEMLYDSARVDQAKEFLTDFKEEFGDDEFVQEWVTSIEYDLEHLAPGMEAPSFSVPLLGGEQVDSATLQGNPYIIEFVNFEDPDYQFTFPLISEIYQEYNADDLQIITIPTHESDYVIDSFTSENEIAWHVARAGAFTDEELIDIFNVDQIPVRLLVDAEGRIVRKYYDPGIQELELDLIQQRHQPDIL